MDKRKLIELWEDKFDAIYCIHYLQYTDKINKLISELDRVGILDTSIFEWHYTFKTPFAEELLKIHPNLLTAGYVECALAHYSCCKQALSLGYKRILILEDDNVFLKDLDKLYDIVKKIPNNYDICFLDGIWAEPFRQEYEDKSKKHLINDYFIELDKMFTILTNAICYNKRGMIHLIKNQEHSLQFGDVYTRFTKGALEDSNFKRLFATQSIAIQNPHMVENSVNGTLSKQISWINTNTSDYQRIGKDFNQYNI